MLFKEAVIEQVVGSLGHEASTLVLFKEVVAVIDEIYELTLIPQLAFILAGEAVYIQIAENQIRLHLNPKVLDLLCKLNQRGSVQFGSIGKNNLYFTLNTENNIQVVPRANTLYGQTISPRDIIFPQYELALRFLEQFRTISQAIVHKQTGVITLFLEDEDEYYLDPTDPIYPAVKEIISGEYIQIGVSSTDRLCYYAPIGFFNADTGALVTNSTEDHTVINPGILDVISKHRNAKQPKKEPRRVIRKAMGEHRRSTPSHNQVASTVDPYSYIVEELEKGDTPIQVGYCAGKDHIYYCWQIGILSMNKRSKEYRNYHDVRRVHPIADVLLPGTHIYRDEQNPLLVYLLPPQLKLTHYDARQIYFKSIEQLLSGAVGIIHNTNGSDESGYLVSYTSNGVLYTPFTGNPDIEQIVDTAAIKYFNIPNCPISEVVHTNGVLPTAKQLPEQDIQHKPTRREKKNQELKGLPQGRRS